MYHSSVFTIKALPYLEKRILTFLKPFETCCFLNGNQDIFPPGKLSYSRFRLLAAAGSIKEINSSNYHGLTDLQDNLNDNWLFGFFSYDLKNKIEKLNSNNIDFLFWPDLFFFQPEYLLKTDQENINISCHINADLNPEQIFEKLLEIGISVKNIAYSRIKMTPRLSKSEYIDKVNKLKQHIQRGDIYEVNFCQEFYAEADFDPFTGYYKLSQVSPTPFSSFFRLKNKYLLSASPERFLARRGNKLISQPIKGTSPRGNNPKEDTYLKELLHKTPKERSENVMIVDLVRNDLSRISKRGTVKVDELCGIYSFKQFHHMISTVSSETEEDSIEKIIKATFPMGSMTGAPKIKAMRLAEKYETTKRGLYSGAVGYIAPNGDFDFNVVIRSLQYNSENRYLSYLVGGAITFLSDPENEYLECLVKASGIEHMLKS